MFSYKNSKTNKKITTNRTTNKIFTNKNNLTKEKEKKYNDTKLLIIAKKLFSATTYINAKELLKEFYINLQISDSKFDKIQQNIIPFSKSGRSGAIIGLLKNNKQNVIKFFNEKHNIYNSFTLFDCLKISNRFNEIFINYLLTNINNIITIKKNDNSKIKNHIIPILNYGISNKGSYITMPLLGLTTQNNNNLITNLRELIDLNHKQFLIKALNENRTDILLEYDKFMSKKIKEYFEVLKLLQKYLKYVNSDVKLTNVFIKKTNKITNKILNDWGFITNFILILSDLEKSSISINNLKITTEPRSNFKITLAKLVKKGLIYDIRYGCDTIIKSCNKINIFDIDILTFIIDYYALMIRIYNDYISTMNNIYTVMNEFIDTNILKTLINVLNQGEYKIDKHYSYIISNILQKICQKL
jgi:hypothetical protein